MKFGLVRKCRGDAYVVYPMNMLSLDMQRCAKMLENSGMDVTYSEFMLNANEHFSEHYTLYRTGRLLISPCPDEKAALIMAKHFYELLSRDGKVARMLSEGQPLFEGEGLDL
ncbi:MAG: hypothetical protein QXP70_03850 [Methanomassiliicoccales archaeon]